MLVPYKNATEKIHYSARVVKPQSDAFVKKLYLCVCIMSKPLTFDQ